MIENFSRRIVMTNDGTHTLYVDELDEHYHSTNGAYNEAVHVYIEAALLHRNLVYVNVLEVGFGTGLNAFLTSLIAHKNSLIIKYSTIELYPLSIEEIKKLNYASVFAPERRDEYLQMHESEWNKEIGLNANFILMKLNDDLKSIHLNDNYDVVYYDAFAPDKQPDLWNEAIFSKIYEQMNLNGILTTYCAKGVVRRMLQSVGFKVERIPGPAGKREMLRATKI